MQHDETPLHGLSQNPHSSAEMFTLVATKLPMAALVKDRYACTPLHYICESKCAASERYVHAVLAHCAESLGECDQVGPCHTWFSVVLRFLLTYNA